MSAALLFPPIAGYPFDHVPDLNQSIERERLSPAAIKGFLAISDKWQLTEAQARGLLGGIASSTFHAWKTEPNGKKFDQDTLTRISLVIGISKSLNIYFSEPWADSWVTLANRGPMFVGSAPLDFMLRYGLPGIIQVRRMLDSWLSER